LNFLCKSNRLWDRHVIMRKPDANFADGDHLYNLPQIVLWHPTLLWRGLTPFPPEHTWRAYHALSCRVCPVSKRVTMASNLLPLAFAQYIISRLCTLSDRVCSAASDR